MKLPRIHFVVFDEETGRIKRSGYTNDPEAVERQAKPEKGEAVAVTEGKVDGARFYVEKDAIKERPELDVAEEIEVAIGKDCALALPQGTAVARNMVHLGSAGEGPVRFAPAEPGVTELRLKPPFPYRPRTVTVTAGKAEMVARQAEKREAARRSFRGLVPEKDPDADDEGGDQAGDARNHG